MKDVIEVLKRIAVLFGLTAAAFYAAHYISEQQYQNDHEAWRVTMTACYVIGTVMLSLSVMLVIKILNKFLQWVGISFK